MKLYNSDGSPYCARVRYFIYASTLPIDIVPQDFNDPAFRKINPLKKVPTLELDNGEYARPPPARRPRQAGRQAGSRRTARQLTQLGETSVSRFLPLGAFRRIFESEVILEWAADMFRPPVFRAILPADPVARARSRFVSRIVDLYIGPHTPVLYNRFPEAHVREAVQNIHKYLDLLEGLGPDPLFTPERRPVAGDLAVGAFLLHAELLGQRIGLTPFEGRPKLRAFYDRLLKDPDFAKVKQENIDAFAQARAAAKAAKAAKEAKQAKL